MTAAFSQLNGQRLTSCVITVPNKGPWSAVCDFEGAPPASGRVTLTIGTTTLSGTIVENGTFALRRSVTVVGGAGAWDSVLPPKSYANDAGVSTRLVASDAAVASGESIGSFVPSADRLGPSYARQAVPASVALEAAAGTAAWWVDFAGVTQVGPRPSAPLVSSAYEILSFDPRTREAVLSVSDLSALRIGSVIVDRLDAPATVRSIELTVETEGLRARCWCGGGETKPDELAGMLRAIIERVVAERLYGIYRFRCVQMSGDRVDCQPVRADSGLPQMVRIPMAPGVAGAHATLAVGAEVFLCFEGGDRSRPMITGFVGKGGNGFQPSLLQLADGVLEAARRTDSVRVTPTVGQTITIGSASPGGPVPQGTPLPFVLTPGSIDGTITSGTSKVLL